MVFDNVTVIIVGLIVVSVLALVYGEHEVLVMVVGGLLGFLSKDRIVTNSTEPVNDDVGAED